MDISYSIELSVETKISPRMRPEVTQHLMTSSLLATLQMCLQKMELWGARVTNSLSNSKLYNELQWIRMHDTSKRRRHRRPCLCPALSLFLTVVALVVLVDVSVECSRVGYPACGKEKRKESFVCGSKLNWTVSVYQPKQIWGGGRRRRRRRRKTTTTSQRAYQTRYGKSNIPDRGSTL